MSESEKEQVKHLANYLNGLAIVFFAGGVIGPFVAHVGDVPLALIIILVVLGMCVSLCLHRLGNQLLRQITT